MTFVKAYTDDEVLEKDVDTLKQEGISTSDIFVLSHDDDRTARIVKNTEASNINYNQEDLGEDFAKKGDELRAKLQEVGLSKQEAEEYEAEMDKGKVFLLVTDEKAETILS